MVVRDVPYTDRHVDEQRTDEQPQPPVMYDVPTDVRVKEGEELTITIKVTGMSV